MAAPLEAVWRFHSRVEGLSALTPDWLHLRVERAVGPDGEADPEVLVAGSRVTASVRPFGVGPRHRWTSVITEREAGDTTASYRDVMVEGPLPRWEHTHSFRARGDDATVVTDRVVYRLPALGPLSVLGTVGLAPAFRYRHRRIRALLA